MNADLANAGTYNKLRQKQVTSWLAIRNAAAHGQYQDYTREDVGTLIAAVEQFISAFPA
jgi:hypothetical protein